MRLLSVAWRSKVSQPQFGTLEECFDEAGLLTYATEGQMQFLVQLFQIPTRQVPHLNLLQVSPQPFYWVQVRCVRRQRLQVDRIAGLRQERLHLGPPVDRRAVPDHEETIRTESAQVDEELDGVQPVPRRRPHHRVHLA